MYNIPLSKSRLAGPSISPDNSLMIDERLMMASYVVLVSLLSTEVPGTTKTTFPSLLEVPCSATHILPFQSVSIPIGACRPLATRLIFAGGKSGIFWHPATNKIIKTEVR
jgi:hypothetical protein